MNILEPTGSWKCGIIFSICHEMLEKIQMEQRDKSQYIFLIGVSLNFIHMKCISPDGHTTGFLVYLLLQGNILILQNYIKIWPSCRKNLDKIYKDSKFGSLTFC